MAMTGVLGGWQGLLERAVAAQHPQAPPAASAPVTPGPTGQAAADLLQPASGQPLGASPTVLAGARNASAVPAPAGKTLLGQ